MPGFLQSRCCQSDTIYRDSPKVVHPATCWRWEKLYSVLRKPVIFSLSRESSFRLLLGPVRQPGGSSYCGVCHSPLWTMPLCKEKLTRWPHLAAGSNFSLNPVINGFEFSQTCQLFEAIACCARVGCRRGNASFVLMVTTLGEVSPSLQTANY